MFDRIKNIFRSRKIQDTNGNIDCSPSELKKGYFLDYDFKTWEVMEEVVYKWDNGSKDLEFEINDGNETLFLNVSKRSDVPMSIFWKGNINKIDPSVKASFKTGGTPIEAFDFEDKKYFLSDSGYARVSGTSESFEMENWVYEDEEGELIISINKYSPSAIEAYCGKYIQQHDISNILYR